jgi:alpha-1,6-mannosyltransferase
MRLVGTLITLSVITWLIFTRSRRSATRNSALALASLVAFGPVVQPWYLLWSFPLFAASGVRHMRTALAIVSLFALHGLANSSATADTFIDLSDGLAMALVVAIIVAVVISSRRERELINEAGRLGI